MELKLDLKDLEYALSVVGETIGNSEGTAGIYLSANRKKGKLTLTTTDGAHSTTVKIPASVKDAGKTVVKADRFMKYIHKLDIKELRLMCAGGSLEVYTSASKKPTTFGTCDPELFSLPVDLVDPDIQFDLAGKVFKQLIKGVAFCTSTATDRPILQGINFVSDGQRLRVTTTNDRIVAQVKKSIETAEMNLTVSKKTLVHSMKFIKDDDQVTVLSNGTTQVVVKAAGITYYAPVHDGSYPSLKSLLPKQDFVTEFTLQKSELLSVLDRGAIVLEDQKAYKGMLLVEKGKVILEGQTQETSFSEPINTNVKGQTQSVTIDIKRMMDILKNMDADAVTVGFRDKMPLAIMPEGSKNHVCLMMVG